MLLLFSLVKSIVLTELGCFPLWYSFNTSRLATGCMDVVAKGGLEDVDGGVRVTVEGVELQSKVQTKGWGALFTKRDIIH